MDFDAPVFKIRQKPDGALLAIETRNERFLQAGFSVLDTDSGKVKLWQWHDEKSWWQSIETVSETTLFLHGYSPDKSGRHLGIFAIDIPLKKKIWQQESLHFLSLSGKTILSQNPTKSHELYYKLHAETGEVLNASNLKEVEKEKLTKLENDFLLPDFYAEENIYFSKLQNFVKRFVSEQTIIGFDYLENTSYILIGFYFKNKNGQLQQDLLLTDLAGNFRDRFVLDEKCNGRGVDNFFIFRNKLIFIHNRTTLMGIML